MHGSDHSDFIHSVIKPITTTNELKTSNCMTVMINDHIIICSRVMSNFKGFNMVHYKAVYTYCINNEIYNIKYVCIIKFLLSIIMDF